MLAGMEPVRPIAPDDGLLDVIVVRASGRLSGLLGGWEALRQKDLGESREGHVLRAQARKVRIATQPRRLVSRNASCSLGRAPSPALRPNADCPADPLGESALLTVAPSRRSRHPAVPG